jgi:hypothetical protein
MIPLKITHPQQAGLVSVVIPTFKKDKYIRATLDSIGAQSFDNWEVLVVEDSSFGRTEEFVRAFARKHRRNRVVYSRNERNYGAAHSRNVGFAQAKGEYVALVDADDRWLPEHLATAVRELQAYRCDIVYSTVIMVEDESERILGYWGPTSKDCQNFPGTLLNRCFLTPSSTVMRRSVLEDVGGWDPRFRYCEDLGYWLQCVQAGKVFRHIGGCHCLYRKNHAGATTQRMSGLLEEIADTYVSAPPVPGLTEYKRRSYIAAAYRRAANSHAKADIDLDPSADRRRAPELLMKAWRMQPMRLDLLAKANWRRLRNHMKRHRLPPPPEPTTQIAPPRSAAA